MQTVYTFRVIGSQIGRFKSCATRHRVYLMQTVYKACILRGGFRLYASAEDLVVQRAIPSGAGRAGRPKRQRASRPPAHPEWRIPPLYEKLAYSQPIHGESCCIRSWLQLHSW